jgi:hypothetical protein
MVSKKIFSMHCVSFLGRSRKNKTNHTQYVSQMASVLVYIHIYIIYAYNTVSMSSGAYEIKLKSNPPRMATFLNELPIFRQKFWWTHRSWSQGVPFLKSSSLCNMHLQNGARHSKKQVHKQLSWNVCIHI